MSTGTLGAYKNPMIPILSTLSILGSALGLIKHPAAAAVANALGEFAQAGENGELSAQDKLQAKEALYAHTLAVVREDADLQKKIIAEVNQTFRTEITSKDAYVRRWRPTFGYIVGITWGIQGISIAILVLTDPDAAAKLITSLESMTTMWVVALGVLGINVVKRSHDKQTEQGQTPLNPLSLLSGLTSKKE